MRLSTILLFEAFALLDAALAAFSPFTDTRLTRLLFLLLSALCATHWMALAARRRARIFIPIYSVLLTLLALEGVAMCIPESHGNGQTLAARLWARKYWWPINHLRFRDLEPSAERLAGKRKIIVLGDSLVSGVGIADYRKRFSNLLEAKLPPGHIVLNAGWGGADTRDEFGLLNRYPVKPDLLVLAYYMNDIDVVAIERGAFHYPTRLPYADRPLWTRWLIENSYVVNYLYWRFPKEEYSQTVQSLMAAYRSKPILDTHLGDLSRFITYHRRERIPLVVVLFPFLEDLSTRIALDPVADLFERAGVPVIDVATLTRDLPVGDRVVNSHDGHGSLRVNEIVAEALYRAVTPLLANLPSPLQGALSAKDR